MRESDLLGRLTAQNHLPAHALGDTTINMVVFVATRKCRIRKVSIVPDTVITGSATNNFNLNVMTVAVNGTATQVAQKAYGAGTNSAALVEEVLYQPTTPPVLPAGASLAIQRELVGAGIAMPRCAVKIEYDNGSH